MREPIPYLEKQGMLSRALIIATVTILIGCITAVGVRAQENLERGKSPSQIFSGTCSTCHKSPRGLLKNVPASSLQGFLRQHYTTGSEMAGLLASFLISNGAADPRYQPKDQSKQKDARPDQPDRFGRRQQPAAPATETSRTEPDRARPQGEGARSGRDARRQARPTAAPDANRPADGEAPVQAATDSKQGAKQKLGKRAKPAAEEPPKTEEAGRGAAKDEPSSDAAKMDSGKTEGSKTDTAKTNADKDDAAADAVKTEGDKPAAAQPPGDAAKPAGEANKPAGEASKPADAGKPTEAKSDAAKPDTAKVDAPKESAGSEPAPVRPDSVPSAAPASPSSSSGGGTPEPAASPSAAAPPATPAPAAPPAAATAPASSPAASAGQPVPPISR